MDTTQKKEIHLAAFDFDGTLFLTDKAIWKSYQKALRTHGFEMDYNTYKTHCDGKDYRTFLGLLYDITDVEMLTSIHKEKQEAYREFYKFITPDLIVLQTAKQLHSNCKTAIVTTASRSAVEDILEIFNCSKFFDIIIAKEDVAHQKPSPEGYLKAMIQANACPSTTIIFEDSKTGIQAATLSGASVMQVTRNDGVTSFVTR
jgi:sugar-phosphatase